VTWLAIGVIAWATINALAFVVGWRWASHFHDHEQANLQIQREVVDRLAVVGEELLKIIERDR
jgi:hypothetical protein